MKVWRPANHLSLSLNNFVGNAVEKPPVLRYNIPSDSTLIEAEKTQIVLFYHPILPPYTLGGWLWAVVVGANPWGR